MPALPSPTEAKSPLNENVKLVEEALASGDIDGAKQLYKDLPKEGYMPSFEDIKKGFDRTNDHFTAKDANREAKDLNEGYGAFQKDVQNFKSKLRAAADQKNSSGMLNREHMPKDMFGGNSMASDDVATRLGMTENQFMEKLINELDVKKGGVPKAPKEVAVPREQLPIGEGKEKVSKLEARMKGVIGKATQEQKDELGLSTFNQMNNKDTIKKAAEFAINNPKDAIKVLEGKMEVPAGLNSNSIFVAMANNPELTSELAIKLASLKSTAMGQNIEILKALNKNNPVAIASDIYKIKEAEFSKRYGGKTIKEVTDKYIEKGQKEIKPPKISDWGSIIKEVRC